MADKVFKDGKLIVVRGGGKDSGQGSKMPDPKVQQAAYDKKAPAANEPEQRKLDYSSAGRNNEPLTKDVIEQINKLKTESTTESLISLIQYFGHPKWLARKLASDAMVEVGEKAVPLISQTVFLSQSSLNEDSLYWSIRTLGMIGNNATSGLITMMNSPNLPKSHKIFVVRALENCKNKEAIGALISCFTDDSWVIRREAGNTLAKLGDVVVPYLKTGFAGGNEDIRYWSVKILGGILGSGAIEYFKKMLKSDKRDMRYFAAAALGEIDSEDALDALAEAFSDDSWLVRAQVSEILEKKGTASVRVLKKVLETGSSDAKFLSVKLMSKVMGRDAISYISKIATKADTELKFFALSALAETLDETAMGTLVDALSDKVWLVRKHASALLEKFGLRVVPYLKANLSTSKDENLRYWSIVTLCNIGKPAMEDIRNFFNSADKKEKITLIQNLRRDAAIELSQMLFESFSDKHWPVRNEAYKKLCEIPEYLVPTIFDYANHPSSDIRYWVNQILKNNEMAISKSLLNCMVVDKQLGEIGDALKQNAMNLLLKLSQPDVVTNMIEHAIANCDANLLMKLRSDEFFEGLFSAYMDDNFESKSQKFRDFVVEALKFLAPERVQYIKGKLKDSNVDRKRLMTILSSVSDPSVGEMVTDMVDDDDPKVRLNSLKTLLQNMPNNEGLYDKVIETFKGEDEGGRLKFISEMPPIKNDKMLRLLINQFRICNEADCVWFARLIVEWGAHVSEYFNGIMGETSDPKIKFWLSKVVNHINGVEFL